MSLQEADAPHVVIVGAGFGGLYAARALAKRPVRITVIDRNNYHLFSPLVYQVATAALSPGEVAQPVRALLRRQPNAHVIMAEVTGIDPQLRVVHMRESAPPSSTEARELPDIRYDYLIVAAGARHSYFGNDEWAPFAPGLKTVDDALEIRRRILGAYEAAEREPKGAERDALLTFVVIGGGPTGVELAGALSEIARKTLTHEFREIDPAQSHVLLLEAGPRLLPSFPEELSVQAARQLKELGVDARTGTAVTDVTAAGVQTTAGPIDARTVLWAAGVAASPLAKTLGAPLDRSGRATVSPDLSVPGRPEVFVIGDLASFVPTGSADGRPLPGVAQVAIQGGNLAAENIWRSLQGEPRRVFQFKDPGSMATIGRSAAVAHLPALRLQLTGFIAWMAWLVVHLFWLIGLDNRLLVLMRWAWAYFTHRRGARLITGGASSTGPPRVTRL